MKIIISILSLILIPQSFALFSQKPDLIITDNDEEVIWEYPLEDYLKYFCDIKIVTKFDADFCGEDRPYLQCKWKVEDEKLYLCSVRLPRGESMGKLFPEQTSKVHASWYSGLISYQHGKLVSHDYSRDMLVLENWTVYHVSEGIVTKQTTINIPEQSVSYSKAVMKNMFPLAEGTCPKLFEEPDNKKRKMTDFLKEVFSQCQVNSITSSYICPRNITIKINANLDDFEFKDSHRKLSCYKLLEAVSEETGTVLDIRFQYEGDVLYEIREGLLKFITKNDINQLSEKVVSAYNSNNINATWDLFTDFEQADLKKDDIESWLAKTKSSVKQITSSKYVAHEYSGHNEYGSFYTLHYEISVIGKDEDLGSGQLIITIAATENEVQISEISINRE